MDLIQKLAEPPVKRPEGKSIMDVWVESRKADEQSAILAAAVDSSWGHVPLLNTLVAEGAPNMSDTAFRAWRKRKGLA